ncbi:MAG: DUF1007 family protein [Candidatus Sabulitectum sp.]|nr:DUF1007 family protein [Candidatus Sabulitectum sp.]
MKRSILLLIVPWACVFAHPHMFIDTEMEIRLQGELLAGIEITWYFDPMFTAAISTDFDSNGNGQFSAGETSEVFANAFSNLETSNYFTFVNINGQTYSPTRIEEFSVFTENGTLVYRFFCPFNIHITNGVFRVAIYDSAYYCDILYREGAPITLSGTGSETAQFEIEQNGDISISYGGNVSVSREGTTYSGTAYPQQLVVYLNSD